MRPPDGITLAARVAARQAPIEECALGCLASPRKGFHRGDLERSWRALSRGAQVHQWRGISPRSRIPKCKESKVSKDAHSEGDRKDTEPKECASTGDSPLSDQTGESPT